MKSIELYIQKKTYNTHSYFEGTAKPVKCAHIYIIIPCLAESAYILHTIDSVYKSALQSLYTIQIICVVNNRASADSGTKANNQTTLNLLAQYASEAMPLIYIDATSEKRCIPENQGVGFARKIGMDYAVSFINDSEHHLDSGCKSILVCLDADTLAAETYISTIGNFFFADASDTTADAIVLPFLHQGAADEKTEQIIRDYERYLHHHSAQLQDALSPYYHIALGSAIACTVDFYCASGGMNLHLAGEDFYFLQQLIKTGTVESIQSAENKPLIFPSSRISQRVPFGTGIKLKNVLSGSDKIEQYPSEVYYILKEWIHLVSVYSVKAVQDRCAYTNELISNAQGISPVLVQFLHAEQFSHMWELLFENNRKSSCRLQRSFHVWFDGLKTIRFFHFFVKVFFEKQ